MDKFKFQYLAGYIDGDGCFNVSITIQKPKNILVYEYSIQISSVDEFILDYFKQEFLGFIHYRKDKRSDRRDCFIWCCKTNQAKLIAKNVFPYLVAKNIQCKIFLSLTQTIKPNKGIKVSEKIIEHRNNILENLKNEIHNNDLIDEKSFAYLKTLKKCIEPTDCDFSYFSGLIDAEGCFRIARYVPKRKGRNKTHISTLEIGNTKFSIFPWLIQRFGGTICFRKSSSRNQRNMIIWALKSATLNKILDKIYPHLKVKKVRCEKLIQLRETIIPIGGNRKSEKFKLLNSKIISDRDHIYEELKKFNAKGKH